MSTLVDFSEDDLLRGAVVEPAWYRVQIDEVNQALSKAGDSTNFILKGKILFNADTGDTKFARVSTPYWNFNTKAKGFMVGFFRALGVEIKPGVRVDFDATAGKQIDVFIENGLYNGNTVNQINHKYRAPRD